MNGTTLRDWFLPQKQMLGFVFAQQRPCVPPETVIIKITLLNIIDIEIEV